MDSKNLKNKFVTIIFGPTASGKSDLAEDIAKKLQEINKLKDKRNNINWQEKKKLAEIINCDVGQFYTKLAIGTAKPNYKNSQIKQHLFDIIDEPKDFNVLQYRKILFEKIEEIFSAGNMPILVGGSGFYIKSLFFPPIDLLQESAEVIENKDIQNWVENIDETNLWPELNKIDPERASKILKGDFYRIKRALYLWKLHGIKPSELAPKFNFPYKFIFIFLNVDRKILYERIEVRTDKMLQLGWIEEVENLIKEDVDWITFLKKKKLVGHDIIVDYILNKNFSKNQEAIENLSKKIKQETRNYAKRQIIFWRSLKKELENEIRKKDFLNIEKSKIIELDYSQENNFENNLTCDLNNSFENNFIESQYLKNKNKFCDIILKEFEL